MNKNKKILYDVYASKATKRLTIALAVLCFVSAGISLLTLMVAETFWEVFGGQLAAGLNLLNILFYTPLGVVLLTSKDWAIALTITIYTGLIMFASLMLFGTITGIGVFVIGIFCTIKLKQLAE